MSLAYFLAPKQLNPGRHLVSRAANLDFGPPARPWAQNTSFGRVKGSMFQMTINTCQHYYRTKYKDSVAVIYANASTSTPPKDLTPLRPFNQVTLFRVFDKGIGDLVTTFNVNMRES